MTNDIRQEVDNIAKKYFDSSSSLFATIAFYNTSISYTHKNKDADMLEAYDHLRDELLKTHHGDVTDLMKEVMLKHMPSLCLSSLVSAFEEFLTESMSMALVHHPLKITNKNVDFKLLFELSKEEIIDLKVKEHINQIMYKAPRDYLKSLCDILSIDEKIISEEFNKYIEVKARRDLGVHNGWRINDIYIEKVKATGADITSEKVLKPDVSYCIDAFGICMKLVKSITNSVCSNLYKIPVIFANTADQPEK